MTTVSGAPSSASISIGTTDGLQDALYLKEPGSADPVSMGDIHQGSSFGDCFLLAVVNEITRQSVIQDALNLIPYRASMDERLGRGEPAELRSDRRGRRRSTPLAIDDAGMGNPRSSDLQTITQVLC